MFFSLFGNIKFNIITTNAAKLIPVIGKELVVTDVPNPITNIADAITTFLNSSKLTLFFIRTLNPLIDIKPYSNSDTPPSTGFGIVANICVILPKNEIIIVIIAANPITHTDATLVIPTTDVFSPYVVLAGPPISPDVNVAKPSPSKVLSNPGSLSKFLPIMLLNAIWSPTCSAIVTNAIGNIDKTPTKVKL